jgi:hypothetical protein
MKVSKYWPMKLLIVQWSSHVTGQYLNLSGLELKDMLIQQELIFIKMDRTNIPERIRSFTNVAKTFSRVF